MVMRAFLPAFLLAVLTGTASALLPSPAAANTLSSLVMPGELVSAHAKYERQCQKCHDQPAQTVSNASCLACHEEQAADIEAGTGFHGRLKNMEERKCKDCHGEHKGRRFDIMGLDKETFDHRNTDFLLKGEHLKVECARCHGSGNKYRDASHQCSVCHKDDEPHEGRLGDKCTDCHSEAGWRELKFDHAKTRFPLTASHKDVACGNCHPDRRFKETARNCYACHGINDIHAGHMGRQCDKCHETTKWTRPKFDHRRDTSFPLTGKHDKVSCESCHKADPFRDKPATACVSCHEKDDEHEGRRGRRCDDCHTPLGWAKTTFDHAQTRFPLRNSHASVACGSCHKGAMFEDKLSLNCVSCHEKNDPHKNQEGDACEKCHTDRGWRVGVAFSHDLTRFPLTGLHTITPCAECHLGASFQDAETQCVSCHRKDDPHGEALGRNCERCHTPNGWRLWNFDHGKETGFPLEGKHERLVCTGCHKRPAAADGPIALSADCHGCHAKDEPHRGAYGRECGRCHTPQGFNQLKQRLR